MLEIDGAQGEGGGQILRSSLALSICTQQAFRITNVRANRDKPGLKRQHLTAVKAAGEICDAEIDGAALASRELVFRPGRLRPGSYLFSIGTAGSSTLVLQTVLPPLLMANAQSTVRISGGTHNRGSPPFDFLERAFLPQLVRMGANLTLELQQYGFYPRGGGEIRLHVDPTERLDSLDLHERGEFLQGSADSYIAALPPHIAERELDVIAARLRWPREQLHLRALPNHAGPGNAVTITVKYAHVTEVFTGFGERGLRAEAVAESAVNEAEQYLGAKAPVGEHLADQLLLPVALAGGGSYTATHATMHLRSNALVIERFLGRRTRVEHVAEGWRITMG